MEDRMNEPLSIEGLVLLIVFFGVFFSYLTHKSDLAIASLERYLDCGAKLTDWRMTHPGMHPGNYLNARRIIVECIEACREFNRYHPYCEEHDHIAWLHTLLETKPDAS